MKEKRNLTAILKKDRLTGLLFGGMVVDGLILISLLALIIL